MLPKIFPKFKTNSTQRSIFDTLPETFPDTKQCSKVLPEIFQELHQKIVVTNHQKEVCLFKVQNYLIFSYIRRQCHKERLITKICQYHLRCNSFSWPTVSGFYQILPLSSVRQMSHPFRTGYISTNQFSSKHFKL